MTEGAFGKFGHLLILIILEFPIELIGAAFAEAE
jgi:hypothetical protein